MENKIKRYSVLRLQKPNFADTFKKISAIDFFSTNTLLYFSHKKFEINYLIKYFRRHQRKIANSRLVVEDKILECGDNILISLFYHEIGVTLSKLIDAFANNHKLINTIIENGTFGSGNILKIFEINPKLAENELFRVATKTCPHIEMEMLNIIQTVKMWNINEDSLFWLLENFCDLRKDYLYVAKFLAMQNFKECSRRYLENEIQRKAEKQKKFGESVRNILKLLD
jgi:hypothetical protein